MFEKDLPGENTAGFNKSGDRQAAARDLRDDQRLLGLQQPDNKFKTRDLIRYLVRAAGQTPTSC